MFPLAPRWWRLVFRRRSTVGSPAPDGSPPMGACPRMYGWACSHCAGGPSRMEPTPFEGTGSSARCCKYHSEEVSPSASRGKVLEVWLGVWRSCSANRRVTGRRSTLRSGGAVTVEARSLRDGTAHIASAGDLEQYYVILVAARRGRPGGCADVRSCGAGHRDGLVAAGHDTATSRARVAAVGNLRRFAVVASRCAVLFFGFRRARESVQIRRRRFPAHDLRRTTQFR